MLKVKERLARQKTITQLNEVSSDEKKCKSISDELSKLLNDKSLINEELEATTFIVDRHLVHKMMDQKQVLRIGSNFYETRGQLLWWSLINLR